MKMELPGLIGNWCQEAVAAHGDDWQGIFSYIRTKMAELAPHEREALDAEGRLTLMAGNADNTAH